MAEASQEQDEMSLNKEKVMKFVGKLIEAHDKHIESVLSYKPIQGEECLVVVMRDEVEDVPEFLAEVYDDCSPPEGTMWLRRHELFQLTLGVGGVLGVPGGEGPIEPFDSWRVKSKSEILYGCDIREEIPDLDDLKGAVMANLTLYLCYIRNHVTVNLLSRKEYKKAAEVLLEDILEYIMALALAIKGKLDVEELDLLDDFSKEYPDTEQTEMLSELFNRKEDMTEASEDDERWKDLAYDAVWAFESLSRWIWREL